MDSGIYCIENILNNKRYIGQSKHIHYRWRTHIWALRNNTHENDYLQKSWNANKEENFIFYILELCDENCLNDREIYYIDLYKTYDRSYGYNLTFGGQGHKKYTDDIKNKISKSLIGHIVSEESRKKIKDHHADVSGKNHPMYGRKHTEESKKKMSESKSGIISNKRNRTNVFCVELNKVFEDATTAANILNLDSSGILKCCRKKRKTCGGYHWEFINLEKNNIS